MTTKKRGQRPIVAPTRRIAPVDDQTAGYRFDFAISPDDSALLARFAHRAGATPGDVMQQAIGRFLLGLRAGVL